MDPLVPFSVNPQVPVTPPPEHPARPVPAMPFDGLTLPLPPDVSRAFAPGLCPMGPIKLEDQQKTTVIASPLQAATPGLSQPQQQEQQQQHHQQTNGTGGAPTAPTNAGMPPPDPRVVAMAGKIAAHYQQRCQNVVNYQQQRVQEWAETYRRNCQFFMGAATLIVAWYVRDRIQRRRRREHRRFRRGLEARCAEQRTPIGNKMERVRRWAMGLPQGVPGLGNVAAARERPPVWDGKPCEGKDNELYDLTNRLIRSQVTGLNIPTIGELDLGSDPGSETDDEEEEEEEEEVYDQAIRQSRAGEPDAARCTGETSKVVLGQRPDSGENAPLDDAEYEEEYTEYDDDEEVEEGEGEEDYDDEEDEEDEEEEYMDYETGSAEGG